AHEAVPVALVLLRRGSRLTGLGLVLVQTGPSLSTEDRWPQYRLALRAASGTGRLAALAPVAGCRLPVAGCRSPVFGDGRFENRRPATGNRQPATGNWVW